eukprot:PhM_4_TR8421/c0_g3_i1/m.55443
MSGNNPVRKIYASSRLEIFGRCIAPRTKHTLKTWQYLVKCNASDATVVIDCADRDIDVWKALAGQAASPTALWLTHADHASITGLKRWQRALPDVPVRMHRKDIFWEDMGFWERWKMLKSLTPMPTTPSSHFFEEDGETATCGELNFEVIHTASLTPGQLVFYCRDEGLAFTGNVLRTDDDIFHGPKWSYGCQRILGSLHGDTLVLGSGSGIPSKLNAVRTSVTTARHKVKSESIFAVPGTVHYQAKK